MKIGIIGSGLVGATSSFAIMMRKAASEIVLIDASEKKVIAPDETGQGTGISTNYTQQSKTSLFISFLNQLK
jgi:malate/lactate dehydrogenase